MLHVIDYLLVYFAGHEPHQLVRDNPRAAVCLVCGAVLRAGVGSACAGPDEGVLDVWGPPHAQPVPAVPGRPDRGRPPHPPLC